MNTKNASWLGGLLHLVDPTLPIGGFNHSNGLETFTLNKIVHNKDTLQRYLETQLLQNWVFSDGAYCSLAFEALQQGDLARLIALDNQLGAGKIAREIKEGNAKLGNRLLKIFTRYEQHPLLDDLQQAIKAGKCKGYFALVFGVIAAVMDLPKAETLYAFYYNALVGAVTNGVKLIPLSQMDGQDILFALRGAIEQAVEQSLAPNPDWLGVATIAGDIRAMQHERLYSRLYMS